VLALLQYLECMVRGYTTEVLREIDRGVLPAFTTTNNVIILMDRKNGGTLGYLACHVAATARGKQVPACERDIG